MNAEVKENHLEKRDLLYFSPLFHFFDSYVPVQLGKRSYQIEVFDSNSISIKGNKTRIKENAALKATVTFEESSVPKEVKHNEDFLNFSYVRAMIEAQNLPKPSVTDEETMIFNCIIQEKACEDQNFKPTTKKEIILVKANEAFIYFIKKYNLGLCPLAYYRSATPVADYSYVAKIGREVIINQFGADFPYIFDSQRIYFSVGNDEQNKYEKYLLFDYVLAMYSFAQIHIERKFVLPNNEACIIFKKGLSGSDERDLEAMFFDNGIPLEDKKITLKEHPNYLDKIKNTILLVKRKNRELEEKHSQLKREQIKTTNGFRIKSQQSKKAILHSYTKKIAFELPIDLKVIVEDIQKAYIQLTNLAAKNKEIVLNKIDSVNNKSSKIIEYYEKSPQLREDFITLPGNTEGLWPNFAALPAGYCRDLSILEDARFGESIKITRSILEYKNTPIEEQHAPLIIPLEKVAVEDIEKEEKIECINLLLDNGQCPGYIVQGIIVLSKLLRDLGGLKHPGKMVRIHYDDFIDTLRSNRENRSRALGVSKDEKAFFRAIIELLNIFYYKRTYKPTYSKNSKKPLNNWDEIRGLFHVDKRGENKNSPYYDIHFNQNLFKLLDPNSDSPLFLQSNAKAILAIPEQSLDYVPAAQLSLENLARNNLYGKDRNTLLFGEKGYESGITRLRLIRRFGLLKGKNEDMSHILKRLDRILRIEEEVGVIKEVRLNGREAKDKLYTQLFIDMHDDYKTLFNINKWQDDVAKLKRQLEAFLNPQYLTNNKKS